MVGGLPSGERVDLEVENGTTLRITSGRYQTHLRGIDADEFPVIPAAGERPTTRISQKVLRKALAEVTFAAASDEARPILTGVLTRFSGDRLTLAAADNYRIAVKTLQMLLPVEDTSLVVPARSYTELMRILSDTDDPVDIMLAPARSQVDLPRRHHRAGQPAHRRPVPQLPAGRAQQSHDTRAIVDRDELLKAVRLSALIASSAANVVKLRIGEEGSAGITIAAAADVGDAEGQVEATLEGDPVTVAFNARYLTEALQNVDGDQLALELNGPLSSGRVQAHRR